MSLEREFVELGERLTKLGQRHAVLVAREEQKSAEREVLEKELKAAGVDVTRLDEEAARLEAEMRKALMEAKAKVDAFEVELSGSVSAEKAEVPVVKKDLPVDVAVLLNCPKGVMDDDLDI